jgi:short-subunit dehydrogenase
MTNTPRSDGALKRRFGPTAVITGSSDGIGRAFAVELAEQGFDLILVARRDNVLLDLARDLKARFGVDVRVLALDLSDPAAVPKLLAFTEDTPVGLVVAAAGFGSVGAFLDQDAASEMNMVDLNCRSVVELSYGFGLRMAVQKRGGIVLFGSLLGFNGAPLSATYAATKGFIQSFAEGIAVEMRPLGVNVLSVAPGPVGTGFAARAGMQMGKAATPEMVARSALAALGRRTTVRPGFLAKFLGWSLAMLPRWVRVQVMGVIMKGMMGKKTAPKTARDAAVTKG